jgi:hypothetical protein
MTQSALPSPIPHLPNPVPPRTESRTAAPAQAPFRDGETAESIRERNRRGLALLEEWMADESGYDERVWPEIKAALNANRGSQERRLFVD